MAAGHVTQSQRAAVVVPRLAPHVAPLPPFPPFGRRCSSGCQPPAFVSGPSQPGQRDFCKRQGRSRECQAIDRTHMASQVRQPAKEKRSRPQTTAGPSPPPALGKNTKNCTESRPLRIPRRIRSRQRGQALQDMERGMGQREGNFVVVPTEGFRWGNGNPCEIGRWDETRRPAMGQRTRLMGLGRRNR